MANSKSTTSAQASETKQVYLDVLLEYNKSINLIIAILDNEDNIIRASAKAEYKRLVHNWNNYCYATHAHLEATNNDGGIQPEEYTSILDLHKDNLVIFDKAYEAMDKILDKRSKVLKEERHRKMRKKLQEKSCVHHINWLIDYSSHVLTPRTALSAAQVLDVSNNCNTRMALAKEDERRLKDFANSKDKGHIEMIANINDQIVRADAIMIEILKIRDAGNGARVQADTHYVPPNQIPFNSDAFQKRKDVTSVSLSMAQVLVTRPLVPAGEEKEALASLEDGIGAHAPVDVQALVTRPLAPAGEEKVVFKIKATKLLLLMKKMSCLVEQKLEMTSANLAALSSGGEGKLVPRPLASLEDLKDARAPVKDLIPVEAQVLVTRPLAPAGEENEVLASLGDGKGVRPPVKDLSPPVKDLTPLDVPVLVTRPLAPAGHDGKGASLEDGKGACAPVKDLIPVDVQVLVTRPLEELVLLLGKISSLWAHKIKPLKILILMSKYLSPISASPCLQEVHLKDACTPVKDLTLVKADVLVTRLLPAGEGEEALTFFKGGREELVLLLGKISSLWELKIKPLKILIKLKKMSPDDKGARVPVEDLTPVDVQELVTRPLDDKVARAPVEDVTLVEVQELVTRPLPAGEGEEALAFFKGGREELFFLLGKISSLWELKIKPLKILLMSPDDKGARTPVKDLTPLDVQELVTRPAGEEKKEALTIFKGGREELVLLLGKISSLWALKIKPLKILAALSGLYIKADKGRYVRGYSIQTLY
jgi:hypothetical protein